MTARNFHRKQIRSRQYVVGSRAFLIAGAKVWNSLPDDVTSAPSLSTFRAIWRHTYSAAVTTLSDTASTYSDYSGPRGGVAS